MTDSNSAFIMPRRPLICWIFALSCLTACGGDTVNKSSQLEVKARRPLVSALPPRSTPAPVKSYPLSDDQSSQRLLNADTALQAGDTETAVKQMDLINTAELTPEQRSKFQLLDAQLALSIGDAEHAVHKLVNGRPGLLSDSDKIAYYQSLAFAQSLLGEVLPAVSARIRLGNLLQKPEQQQANIASILDMLSAVPSDTLSSAPDLNHELGGWLALAKILKQREQPGTDIGGQISLWRQGYPSHPANAEFLQAYLGSQATQDSASPPQASNKGPSIAVILPASGPYAQPAKAIRAGLAAAQRLASAASAQLPLKFYDSEQGDIGDTYQQAISEGAQQVIGPLIKEQIQSLALHTELTVPVLALNHVDTLSKANLYQFGLSPIDEAQQLVAKARADGRQSAVVLTPNNSQGQRIANYLAAAWQGSGGMLAGSQSYDPKQHDIGAMLNALLATPPGLNVQKTPRAVLLSASPEVARELAPQLKYHQSVDLAVYAMPNVYSGRQSPGEDAELGQFNFCDIPWLFPGTYDGPLNQAALQSAIQDLPETTIRLLPLGIDAYNLLSQLGQLSAAPYNGATGRLSLNGENRITRKLVCAQFKGGVPVANGFVE